MRIIRGKLKGRNIKVPKGVRPVSFRIKKGVFDLIAGELTSARVLDMFAGSGALGIEALSCGASEAVFVDIKRTHIQLVRENILALKLSRLCRFYIKDAFKAVKDFFRKAEFFDFIFLDPPYYAGTVKKALQTLDEYDIVAPHRYIVALCYRTETILYALNHFELITDKRYGQSTVLIYRKK